MKAYNSGLEAAIGTSRDSFGILRLWAFIWDQEVQDYVKASLRKTRLKLATLSQNLTICVTPSMSSKNARYLTTRFWSTIWPKNNLRHHLSRPILCWALPTSMAPISHSAHQSRVHGGSVTRRWTRFPRWRTAGTKTLTWAWPRRRLKAAQPPINVICWSNWCLRRRWPVRRWAQASYSASQAIPSYQQA